MIIIYTSSAVFLYLITVILVWSREVNSSQWATPEEEAMDEVKDNEMLKAVYSSMQDYWTRRLISQNRKKRADGIVCYGEIGCFEDKGPFSYLDMLPSSPEEISTRFLMFAGRSSGEVPLLDVSYTNISQIWPWSKLMFNSTHPTKVIVHGFGSSCSSVWVYEMRSAFMVGEEDCNVICVDWEAGAIMPNYVRAAANTRLVGKQLALLLLGLQQNSGLRMESVHIIGFSLGAHVAGFAGAEIRNISRITGLDPAGPLFESQDPKARLDSTDADFVDVIHSNGENLILGGLGSWQPMGHVDFYPNGGRMQKGCSNLFVGAVSDIIWSASEIEGRSLCNHRRAYKFFTDSVSPRCHFPAFPCESYDKFLAGNCFPCSNQYPCGNMGYYADRSNARGTLYLITRDEEPFCAHQYLVRVESSPSKLPVVSYGKIQITLVGSNEINETFVLTKKDDEELDVGRSLSRIIVPHPALHEPAHVVITYTAYSGWISSGLTRWSVDKIILSDSYGKSLSVCKKDLILESNVPEKLRLYPGECNLPRDNHRHEEIDDFFLPGGVVTTPAVNKTDYNDTELDKIDSYPLYSTNNFIDSNKFQYDYARGFKDNYDSSLFNLTLTEDNNSNYTMKIIRKTEISEPVLKPKNNGRNLLDKEINEPVLKPIEKIQIVQKLENRKWNIDSELYSPPTLSTKQSLDTREAKTMTYPKPLKNILPPNVNKKQIEHYPRQITTLQSKKLKSNRSRESRHRPNTKDVEKMSQQSNKDGVTVQLFPSSLASILKRAEHYTRMSLFSPLDIFTRRRGNETKENLKVEPKFLSNNDTSTLQKFYNYFEKGLENVRCFFSCNEQKENGKNKLQMFAYETDDRNETSTATKFIPLT